MITPDRQTFSKAERLCRKGQIRLLFSKGSAMFAGSFKLQWHVLKPKETVPAQVLFSVSRHQFKKATDRNTIRRRMREVYRKHKHLLYQSLKNQDVTILLAFHFGGKNIPAYSEAEEKIILLLQRLIREIGESREL